jgi:hypothetical protein
MNTSKYHYKNVYNVYLKNLNHLNLNHPKAIQATMTDLDVSIRTVQRSLKKCREEGVFTDAISGKNHEPFDLSNMVLPETSPQIPEPEDLFGFDREKNKLRSQIRLLDAKYRYVSKTLELVEQQVEILTEVNAGKSDIKIIGRPQLEGSKHEAIPFIQATDWHLGERVDPSTVNYFNKYDPDIATDSAEKFFQRSIKLVEKERQDVIIKRMVCHLGGDIITGFIHEELLESNYFSPVEEVMFAFNILVAGFNYWLKNGKFDEIYVICNYGNHGRTNPHKKISTGARNSYEYLLYNQLAAHYAKESRLKWLIAEGDYAYLNVWGKDYRFTHGDTLKSGGGIGGLEIPLKKAIFRWNAQRYSAMTFLGHFHQMLLGQDYTANESLIGANAYSQSLGCPSRTARQSFRLLDSKRNEFTASLPIFVDDGDRCRRKTSYRPLGMREQVESGLIIK